MYIIWRVRIAISWFRRSGGGGWRWENGWGKYQYKIASIIYVHNSSFRQGEELMCGNAAAAKARASCLHSTRSRRWKGDIIVARRVYNTAVCGQDAKEFILLCVCVYIYIYTSDLARSQLSYIIYWRRTVNIYTRFDCRHHCCPSTPYSRPPWPRIISRLAAV